MPKNSLSDVLQALAHPAGTPDQQGTDADLLARFNAEDACQATFLILAQKARTICSKESLGSWLHGVAFRVSSNLRRKLHRQAMRPLRQQRGWAAR